MTFDYNSDYWQEERENALFDSGYCCEICGSSENLHAHHKYGTKYENYEVLCADCHANHHNNENIRYVGRKDDISSCDYDEKYWLV